MFHLNKDQLKQYMIYAVLALSVLINTAIIYSPFIPQNINLEVNDTALSTITAPRYIEFESRQDKIANKKTQNHIKNTIPPVYSINQTINSAIIENIALFFDDIASNPMDKLSIYISQILSSEDTFYLKSISNDMFQQLKSDTLSITNTLLSSGIKEINHAVVKTSVSESLQSYEPSLQLSLIHI